VNPHLDVLEAVRHNDAHLIHAYPLATKLEQYEYAGATAIAVAMLGISFASLLLINLLQRWTSRRAGQTY